MIFAHEFNLGIWCCFFHRLAKFVNKNPQHASGCSRFSWANVNTCAVWPTTNRNITKNGWINHPQTVWLWLGLLHYNLDGTIENHNICKKGEVMQSSNTQSIWIHIKRLGKLQQLETHMLHVCMILINRNSIVSLVDQTYTINIVYIFIYLNSLDDSIIPNIVEDKWRHHMGLLKEPPKNKTY